MNSTEPFWPIAAVRKILMAMILVSTAKGACGIPDVYQMCATMPNTSAERDSQAFRHTFCGQILRAAHDRDPKNPDVNLAASFVLTEWPRLPIRPAAASTPM